MFKFFAHQVFAWFVIPITAFLLVGIVGYALQILWPGVVHQDSGSAAVFLAVCFALSFLTVRRFTSDLSLSSKVWIVPTVLILYWVIRSSMTNGWCYSLRENLWISKNNEGIGLYVGLVPWLNTILYSALQTKYRKALPVGGSSSLNLV